MRYRFDTDTILAGSRVPNSYIHGHGERTEHCGLPKDPVTADEIVSVYTWNNGCRVSNAKGYTGGKEVAGHHHLRQGTARKHFNNSISITDFNSLAIPNSPILIIPVLNSKSWLMQ